MTAPPPLLSPSNILPPSSSQCALFLVPKKKKTARVPEMLFSLFYLFFLENYVSLKLRNLQFQKFGSVYCQGCSRSGRKCLLENPSGLSLQLLFSLKTADSFLRVKLPDWGGDHSPHHSTEVLDYLQLAMHVRGLVIWQRGQYNCELCLGDKKKSNREYSRKKIHTPCTYVEPV